MGTKREAGINKPEADRAAYTDAVLSKTRAILLAHVGKGNAIATDEIRRLLAIEDDSGTRANTRRLLLDAAVMYGLPLASCQNGYFLIETPDEYLEYMANLNSRISGIRRRMCVVSDNYGAGGGL